MKNAIIYRYSKNANYGQDISGQSEFYQVRQELDDNEYYLYRCTWVMDEAGNYQYKEDEDFIKIVSDEWLENRNEYYGKRIYSDIQTSDLELSDYDREVNNSCF